jgi:hypothetical protein
VNGFTTLVRTPKNGGMIGEKRKTMEIQILLVILMVG